jgi:hypothetical protein
MPTREEWEVVYADLKRRLAVPCVLRFSTHVKIGQHVTDDEGCCTIFINPEVDFHVPEHLILHEMAHHRANAFDEYHGHDELWAGVLCRMYEETGIALPYSTGFEAFALIAGIKHKHFEAVTSETVVKTDE